MRKDMKIKAAILFVVLVTLGVLFTLKASAAAIEPIKDRKSGPIELVLDYLERDEQRELAKY